MKKITYSLALMFFLQQGISDVKKYNKKNICIMYTSPANLHNKVQIWNTIESQTYIRIRFIASFEATKQKWQWNAFSASYSEQDHLSCFFRDRLDIEIWLPKAYEKPYPYADDWHSRPRWVLPSLSVISPSLWRQNVWWRQNVHWRHKFRWRKYVRCRWKRPMS